MIIWIKAGRTVWYRTKESNLGNAQIIGIFIKISFRCRFDPVIAIGKVNIVQIKFQNLLFTVLLLQRHGNEHLLNLSAVGGFKIKENVSGQLLGDGTSTHGYLSFVSDQRQNRTGNSFNIDSTMRCKILILHRNDCQLRRVRNIIILQIMYIFCSF